MHDLRSGNFADHLFINENGTWIQRWCSLSRQQLYVYVDRTQALINAQRPLYAFSLHQYQHVEVSGKYTHGKGQWELTLSGEAATRQRQWNDSSDSLVPSVNANWSNKVTSRSKRLYQLVSGSASTQTLATLSETTTVPLRLTFRGTDSRSTTQWADAISEHLTEAIDHSAPPPPKAIPSHARVRRARPATATVAEDYAESDVHRDSNMISAAALASRRKRLDSLGRTLETSSASQLSRDPDSLSKATARPFTAADKFIKASRRVSVEVFATALGNRKSTDAESINQSRPTTSSGTSMRSSICCPGLESKRVSIEIKPTVSTTPNFTSFATFSSPFVSTIRRSSSRRRQSTSSNGTNRSSVHFDPTALALLAQPTGVRPASVLASSASAFDISFSSSSGAESLPRERSSSGMTRSTSYSPAPTTPSLAQTFEPQMVTTSHEDRNKLLMPKSLSTALGFNLYEEQRAAFRTPARSVVDPLPAHESSIKHAIIVESPTSEDLATILANGSGNEGSQRGNLAVRKEAPAGNGKLALSPSMPALHQTFSTGNEDDAASKAPSVMTTSPSFRFASLSKLSNRRTGLLGFKRAPSPKIATASVPDTIQSPGQGSLIKRPATSTGLRTVVSSPQLDDEHRRGSEGQSRAPPMVERILPPQEIIATIDRLKKQNSASSLPTASRSTMTLSDYTSPNRRNVVLPNWRDDRGEVYRPRPTRPIRPDLQARSSSPRLREVGLAAPISTISSSHTFNELSSLTNRPKEYHYQRNVPDGRIDMGRMDEYRAQSPSLPVPPRINRKPINDPLHRRISSREDKENTYLSRMVLESKEQSAKVSLRLNQNVALRSGSQERPKRPLRSSISENISLRAMAQVN